MADEWDVFQPILSKEISINHHRGFAATSVKRLLVVKSMAKDFCSTIAEQKKGECSSLDDMCHLIEKDAVNATVILPYLGGDEINTEPTHAAHRFAMDFAHHTESEARRQWPDLMRIVETRVKPQRAKLKDYGIDKRRKQFWWQYGSRSANLYSTIADLQNVIATSLVSPHLALAVVPARTVFSHNVGVFAYSNFSAFCVLQNRIHEPWARMFSATFEDRLNYRPTDCFINFPFPSRFERVSQLNTVGLNYRDCRTAIMVARNEGMTKTYNRFHDLTEIAEDIQRLRE